MSSFTIVYFLRVAGASGFGLGTQADPYRVLSGSAGDAQIQAFLDTIEDLQGFRPDTQDTNDLMPKPVTVYTWEIDSAVTPVKLSPTIRLDPRSNPQNGTAIANAIDLAVRAQKLARPGEPVALRPWFEWRAGVAPFPFNDGDFVEWWRIQPPFMDTPTTPQADQFYVDLNARFIVLQTPFDYIAQDLEKGTGYFNVPFTTDYPDPADDFQARQTWATPATVANDPNNFWNTAFPNVPNPFIGIPVWNQSLLVTDDFKQIHEQWAVEDRAAWTRANLLTAIRSMKGVSTRADYVARYPNETIPVDFEVLPAANYKDMQYGFPLTQDSFNRIRRLQYGQARIAGVSSPVLYLDTRNGPLLQADASFTTTKEIRNRRRWLVFARILNTLHSSCAAIPGDVHPWIAPPGYGTFGADTWGNASTFEFEKMFTRALWEHCFAAGVDTYVYWNPVANYGLSAQADAWADAYFAGRTVLPLRRDLTEILLPTESVATGSKVTNFADLFQITNFYWQRDPTLTLANSRGFGTQANPYIIGAGSAGDDSLSAMLASIAVNQDVAATPIGATIMPIRTVPLGTMSRDYRINGVSISVSSGDPVTGQVRIAIRKASDGLLVQSGIVANMINQSSISTAVNAGYQGIKGDVIIAEVIDMTPERPDIRASLDIGRPIPIS